MSKLSDESRFRIKQFLGDCLCHVQHISRKPVSAGYLIRKYGDFMRMNEWPDVARTSWVFTRLATSVDPVDMLIAIDRLETL